jgi:hypothetical protein
MRSTIQAFKLACIAAVCLNFFLPGIAHADSAAAPAMFDVEEVIVMPPHFGNDKVAQTCSLTADELGTALTKALRNAGVPAIAMLEAKPPVQGRARISLVTDVFSLNSEGLDCTSWISLTAETRNSVHVPPVDLARNVAVVYWHEGTMLASGQTTHERLITEAMLKMATHFADQYKMDQPVASNK